MNFFTQLLQPREQRNLSSVKTNIAFVWAMVFIGIVMYAMMWFVFGRVAFEIITAVEGSYTFTGSAALAVQLVKYVIAWHPILAMIGWLVWGYINSSRRSVREYESA